MKYLSTILAFLLHHANRLGPDVKFYAIKERILKKFGEESGYDIQVIPGKICFDCEGNGNIDFYTDNECECHRCDGTGWFKSPFFVKLQRYTFHKYCFHIPGPKQFHSKPTDELLSGSNGRVSGYIKHAEPKWYGKFCKLILFCLFDFKTFLSRITPHRLVAPPYYTYEFWKPLHIYHNAIHVVVYLIKTKGKNVPLFKSIADRWEAGRLKRYTGVGPELVSCDDDLPF